MPTKLFVGGIPFSLKEEDLRDFFAPAGEVVSVYIPMDRATGRPRGFAFVEMVDDATADKAISMFHDAEMPDPTGKPARRIAVNKARPQENRN